MPAEQIVTEIDVRLIGEAAVDRYEQRLRGAGQATEQFTADQQKAAQATQTFASAADGVGQRIEQSGRSVASAARAADNYLARLDPVFFATQRLGQEQGRVQVAMQGLERQMMTGAISAETYNQRSAALSSRLVEVQTATQKLAAGTISAADAMKTMATAAERSGQIAAAQSAAIGRVTAGHNDNARAANAATASTGNLRYATQNLTFQLNDLGVQIASGQGLLRPLIQQGAQVAQIFQTTPGLFGQIVDKVKAIGVANIAAAAGVAVLGGAVLLLGERALATDQRLRQFKVTLDTFGNSDSAGGARGLEQAARDLRDMGVAADIANEAIKKLATNVNINPAAVGNIAKTGANVGAVLGIGPEAGIAKLADALGSTDEIIKLGNALNALRPGEEAQIRILERTAGAQVAVARGYNDITDWVSGKFVQSQSDAQRAAQETTNAWNRLLDRLSDTKAFTSAAEALRHLFTLPGILAGGGAGSPEVAIATQNGALGNSPKASSAGGGALLSTSEAATYIAAELNKQLGLDSTTIAAFLANFQAESRLNPAAVNPRSGATGIAQWLGRDRKDVLMAMDSPLSLETQVQFLISELQGKYSGALAVIKQAAAAGGIDAATEQVLRRFEGITPGNAAVASGGSATFGALLSARQASARQFLAGGGGPSSNVNPLAPGGTTAEKTAIEQETAELEKQKQLLADQASLRGKSGLELERAKAAQDAFNTVYEHTKDTSLAMLASQQASQKVLEQGTQEAQRTLSLNELQLSLSKNIAAAYEKSASAGLQAEAASAATIEVFQRTGKLAESRNQIEERYNQILTAQQVSERDRNARELSQQRDVQAQLQLQIGLRGQAPEIIQRELTLLQAKQQIEREFPFLSQQEKDARLATVAATADLTLKLQQVQREQQRVDQAFQQAADTITTNIGGALDDVLSGKKIKSWGDLFLSTIRQVGSQLLKALVIQPAIGSAAQLLGLSSVASSLGTLGGTANALGLGGGSSSGARLVDSNGNVLGTLSNVGGLAKDSFGLFGGSGGSGNGLFSGINSFINNTIGGSLGFATSPTIASLFPGAAATDLGAYAAANTGILSGASSVAGEGLLGSGLLGGASLTSVLGPVGLALGVAGMFGAFDGLFGMGRKPDLASGVRLNIGTGGLEDARSSGVQANDEMVRSIATPLSQIIQTLSPYGTLPAGALAIQSGSRDGTKLSYAGQEWKFNDAASAVEAVAREIVARMTGISDTIRTVLDKTSDPAQLAANLQFAASYDKLSDAVKSAFSEVEKATVTVGPFEQAMAQIGTTFDAMRQKAGGFGLDQSPIDAAQAEAVRRLNQDFSDSIGRLENQAGNSGFLNDLQDVIDSYKGLAREASAIGADRSVHDRLGQLADQQLQNVLATLSGPQLDQVIQRFGDLGITDLPALARAQRDVVDATNAQAAATQAAADAAKQAADAMAALKAQADFVAGVQSQIDDANQNGFLNQLRSIRATLASNQAQYNTLGITDDRVRNTFVNAAYSQETSILRGLNTDQLRTVIDVFKDIDSGITNFAQSLLDTGQAVDQAAAATQALADAAARANEVMQAQIRIREFLNSLETTNSPFTSPESRLSAAQSQYQTQLAAARGGDLTALQSITTTAQTLLQTAQEFYASSRPGQAIFDQVKADLAGLPGVPGQQQSGGTNEIVTAIQDAGDAGVAATTEAAARIIDTAISTNVDIVSASRSSSADIVTESGRSSDRITQTTVSIGADIVNNAVAGAASIAGATTQGLATVAALTDQVADATGNTATAVVANTAAQQGGTMALLASNAANANTLLTGSKEDATRILASQDANASALMSAGAAQSAVLVAQNVVSAAALVSATNFSAETIVARNDNAAQQVIATTRATSEQALAVANGNAASLIATNTATAAFVASRNDAAASNIISTAQSGTASLIAANENLTGLSIAKAEATTNLLAAQNATSTTNLIQNAQTGTAALIAANDSASAAAIATAHSTTDRVVAESDAAAAMITANAEAGTDALIARNDAVGAASIAAAQTNAAAIVAKQDAAAAGIISSSKASTDALVAQNKDMAASLSAGASADTAATINALAINTNSLIATVATYGAATITVLAGTTGGIVTELGAMTASIVRTDAAGFDAVVGAVAAWGGAEIDAQAVWGAAVAQTVAAWGNSVAGNVTGAANLVAGTIGIWGSGEIDATNNLGGWITGAIAAWGRAEVDATNNLGGWITAAIQIWGQADVGYQAVIGNNVVGAIYGAANSLIGADQGNAAAVVATVAAYGEGAITQAARGTDAVVNMLASAANSVTNSVLAAGATSIAAVYGAAGNVIGAEFANGNSIVTAVFSVGNSQVAATFAAANSTVAGMAGSGAGTTQAVYDASRDITAQLGTYLPPIAPAIYDLGAGTNQGFDRLAAVLGELGKRLDGISAILTGFAQGLSDDLKQIHGELAAINDDIGNLIKATQYR